MLMQYASKAVSGCTTLFKASLRVIFTIMVSTTADLTAAEKDLQRLLLADSVTTESCMHISPSLEINSLFRALSCNLNVFMRVLPLPLGLTTSCRKHVKMTCLKFKMAKETACFSRSCMSWVRINQLIKRPGI